MSDILLVSKYIYAFLGFLCFINAYVFIRQKNGILRIALIALFIVIGLKFFLKSILISKVSVDTLIIIVTSSDIFIISFISVIVIFYKYFKFHYTKKGE